MGRTVEKLSATGVSKMTKPGYYGDGAGLYLQVSGREHPVPLSTSALALLRAIPRDDVLVFPGRRTGAMLSDTSLTAVLRRVERDEITVHGFRSTFRDWCSESVANSFPREVCEHALAHSLPDNVETAYRRGDLLEMRVMLMQTWTDYCESQLGPDTRASAPGGVAAG